MRDASLAANNRHALSGSNGHDFYIGGGNKFAHVVIMPTHTIYVNTKILVDYWILVDMLFLIKPPPFTLA